MLRAQNKKIYICVYWNGVTLWQLMLNPSTACMHSPGAGGACTPSLSMWVL